MSKWESIGESINWIYTFMQKRIFVTVQTKSNVTSIGLGGHIFLSWKKIREQHNVT